MHKRSVILVVACCLIIAGVFGVWRFQHEKRAPAVPAVANAVDRGLVFLSSAYHHYQYDDPYLQFVYSGEDLQCPIEGCRITYRVLDAFFDVAFLQQERPDASLLGQQLADTNAVLAAILPTWRSSPIYNVVTAAGEGGLALDTMCILGYATGDRAIAEHVAQALSADQNWIADDYYRQDRWRNIADETWCIRLFATTGTSADALPSLVQKKIDEADAFLGQSNVNKYDAVAVLYHMLYVFADIEQSRYDATERRYADHLLQLANDATIADDTFTQANALDALARTGMIAKNDLRPLAQRLYDRQQANGSWVRSAADPSYPVFTTFRAVLALNKYERLP